MKSCSECENRLGLNCRASCAVVGKTDPDAHGAWRNIVYFAPGWGGPLIASTDWMRRAGGPCGPDGYLYKISVWSRIKKAVRITALTATAVKRQV